jgi:hypothetical protein
MIWVLIVVLGIPGLFFTAMNWVAVLAYVIRKQGSSKVPLLGGGFLAVSMAVWPQDSVRHLWWLPLLLDWGCVPLFVNCAIFLPVEMWRNRSK